VNTKGMPMSVRAQMRRAQRKYVWAMKTVLPGPSRVLSRAGAVHADAAKAELKRLRRAHEGA